MKMTWFFFFLGGGVLQICRRPTVTQLNMEFSNEKIQKKNQAHEELC